MILHYDDLEWIHDGCSKTFGCSDGTAIGINITADSWEQFLEKIVPLFKDGGDFITAAIYIVKYQSTYNIQNHVPKIPSHKVEHRTGGKRVRNKPANANRKDKAARHRSR